MGARSRKSGSLGVLGLVALVLAATWACGRSGPPVAELAVTPQTIEVAFAEAADLRFDWSPLTALEGVTGALRVFVHAIDADGELVRTFDHAFPEAWAPGESVSYSIPIYQSATAPALPEGHYEVRVGLYDESGRRWPIAAPGGHSNEAYAVAGLDVSDADGELPRFSFSSSWLPEEIGRDRQILVRRWLGSSGSIRVAGARAPGTLWLRLATPPDKLDNHTLVLAEGEALPGVVVSTDCSDSTERLGAGEARELRLPIADRCEIFIAPNHHWEEAETGTARSIAVEGIAWIR